MSSSNKYRLSYLLKIGTLVCTSGLIISVIVQIYARFFMDSAPSWTEEASRLFFIYSISFASGLAYKQNYFVFLDLISSKLSPINNLMLEKTMNIFVFILFLIIAIFSIQYIQLGIDERSPSLGINMAFSFASIFIMAFSICFYSGQKIVQLQRKK